VRHCRLISTVSIGIARCDDQHHSKLTASIRKCNSSGRRASAALARATGHQATHAAKTNLCVTINKRESQTP
jgi:hypothetical protein